jgi:hypothetical protein
MTMPDIDFAGSAERILGAAMRDLGLRILISESDHVVFADDHRALSLSLGYDPKDLPTPWLSVTVGLRESASDGPRSIVLWRAYPHVPELQAMELLSITSDSALEAVFGRLRSEWLTKYVVPLLNDEGRLRAAHADQERDLLADYGRRVQLQVLGRARRLFDDSDYQGALDAYVLYGSDRLSAAARRRYVIARRRLGELPNS